MANLISIICILVAGGIVWEFIRRAAQRGLTGFKWLRRFI